MTTSEWHHRLRLETGDLHRATETAFAVFDLATRDGYGAFLTAQAAALLPLEDWLDRHDVTDALPDWPSRRRGALLRADLAALGRPAPPGSAVALTGDPLGYVYVLEGSRHGARILSRAPQASPDPEVARATRFLSQRSEAAAWRGLLAVLDREASTPQRQADMIIGAASAFDLFRRSAIDVAWNGATAPVAAR